MSYDLILGLSESRFCHPLPSSAFVSIWLVPFNFQQILGCYGIWTPVMICEQPQQSFKICFWCLWQLTWGWGWFWVWHDSCCSISWSNCLCNCGSCICVYHQPDDNDDDDDDEDDDDDDDDGDDDNDDDDDGDDDKDLMVNGKCGNVFPYLVLGATYWWPWNCLTTLNQN